MQLDYRRYLDQVLGGWIGKSMGGAVGARFECYKGCPELSPEEMFPQEMPPNDDLDLQVVWLKVLEEKGPYLVVDDLAAAWLEGCWYPYNEYGIFRRNWRLGIHPPTSGRFTNQFWETGMGCPIRAEVWGYVFPGAPDLAARYAGLDGSLDHTEQSIGAAKMLAAMASTAFFVPDVRRLISLAIHHLPAGTPVDLLTRGALSACDEGLSLRDARERLMALGGNPEACDAQINVPFTILGLLYGDGDLQETLLSALRCGYDTDCTTATAGALVGQILGASRIPEPLKRAVGDELVMGIEYRRPEMTLSALARDTARVGVLLSRDCATGVTIEDAPELAPWPETARAAPARLSVAYEGLPAAAPGDVIRVTVRVEGQVPEGARLAVEGPADWTVAPAETAVDATDPAIDVTLHAPSGVAEWPMCQLFAATLNSPHLSAPLAYTFGLAGAGLWQLLGVYYDGLPPDDDPVLNDRPFGWHFSTALQRPETRRRCFQHHFVSLQRSYLPEPDVDVETQYRAWSQTMGRPALIPSYEREIDLSRLVGLEGVYCAYLARTVVSPEERLANVVVGNTDGYRLYLNGELIAEVDERVWWTPFNNVHPVELRAGPNRILLKLLRRGRDFHFTLGFRSRAAEEQSVGAHNKQDWLIDLADVVPS